MKDVLLLQFPSYNNGVTVCRDNHGKKYLRQTIAFMWNSALHEKFEVFANIEKLLFWE